MRDAKSPYSAAFTGCSFMLYEMNRLLPLLLSDDANLQLKREIENNEVLMVNSRVSREKYVLELRRRFTAVPRQFWTDYLNFDEPAQRLAIFYVLLKTYRLVMDFHLNVTMKKWNSIDQHVYYDDIAMELSQIAANDAFVDSWTEATKKRVVSAYLTFLDQAGLMNRKDGTLFRSRVTNEDYAYYIRNGAEWFLEACLLYPYEIEAVKQLAV